MQTNKQAKKRILFAGGGTGGHIFPAIALAEEFLTRPWYEVMFVGTKSGIEHTVIPKAGYPFKTVLVSGFMKKKPLQVLLGIFKLFIAFFQSLFILLHYQPNLVIGVGGYASGPIVLLARCLGFRTAILEQNTVPGRTNRILGKWVHTIFLSFDYSAKYFSKEKAQTLGNPIRQDLLNNFLNSKIPTQKFTLLILGGSQGSSSINNAIYNSLHLIAEPLHVIHQTGMYDYQKMRDWYQEHHIEAEVHQFIDNMSSAYQKADLIVCRSGATTIAELTVCRKASILIPFPFAADNHQVFNAQELVNHGASIMIEEKDLTHEGLSTAITELIHHREKLIRMEQAAGMLGKPHATRDIVEYCIEKLIS